MAIEADILDPGKTEAPLRVSMQHHVPGKPLSEFVAVFWYWEDEAAPPSGKERVLPMGTVELVINLADGRTSQSGIVGPRSESLIIERTAQDRLLGIHFKPGGAFPFLGFPFGDLHNRGITLSDLWGEAGASRLLCLLHESRTVEMKFQVLEQWLTSIADRPLKHHAAVSFAMKEFLSDPGLLSSAEMAERVGFSQRRFIQIFRDEVGLTPKLFCRVQRFQDVITTIQKRDAVDWADIALSFGYSDQSHFIHDFREFSGLSPTEYLGLRTEYPGHVQYRE